MPDWTRKNLIGRKKLNDEGSAMVTIVVVVLFITILATTLLYISSMNYQIKQTDYRNKTSFYSGETSMEKLRAELMKDVSEAAAKAYNDTMTEFLSIDDSDMLKYTYYEHFSENLIDTTVEGGAAKGAWVRRGNWKDWLNSSVFVPAGSTSSIKFTLKDRDTSNGTTDMWDDIVDATKQTSGYLVIRGVCLEYTNEAGYTTEIETDIMVKAPEFAWVVETSPTAPASADDAKYKEIDVSESVKYVNWQKK